MAFKIPEYFETPFNKYEFVKILGEGGSGKVFEVKESEANNEYFWFKNNCERFSK